MAILMVIIVVGLLLVLLVGTTDGFAFDDERWSAISEEAFLAKCPPGTDREVALRVRRIIADQLAVPYERIHPEQLIVTDLGAD